MKNLYLKALLENLAQANVEVAAAEGKCKQIEEALARWLIPQLCDKYKNLSIEHEICGECYLNWSIDYDWIEPSGNIDVTLSATVKRLPPTLLDNAFAPLIELYNKYRNPSLNLKAEIELKMKERTPLFEVWTWTYPLEELERVLDEDFDFSCVESPWQLIEF